MLRFRVYIRVLCVCVILCSTKATVGKERMGRRRRAFVLIGWSAVAYGALGASRLGVGRVASRPGRARGPLPRFLHPGDGVGSRAGVPGSELRLCACRHLASVLYNAQRRTLILTHTTGTPSPQPRCESWKKTTVP